MRSSTTFIIFFGLVLVVLIVGIISSVTTSRSPVVKAAETFVKGVKDNKPDDVASVIDPKYAHLISVGDTLKSINFDAIALGNGSFVKKPAVKWSNVDLLTVQLDTAVQPVTVQIGDTPTATLSCGPFKIYLHQVGNDWKVFYIDKPEVKPQ